MHPSTYRTIGITAAKADWSRLLADVADGETVIITRRGLPVAMLRPHHANPPQPLSEEEAETALANLRARRAGVTLGGLSVREMIDEGRA